MRGRPGYEVRMVEAVPIIKFHQPRKDRLYRMLRDVFGSPGCTAGELCQGSTRAAYASGLSQQSVSV